MRPFRFVLLLALLGWAAACSAPLPTQPRTPTVAGFDYQPAPPPPPIPTNGSGN